MPSRNANAAGARARSSAALAAGHAGDAAGATGVCGAAITGDEGVVSLGDSDRDAAAHPIASNATIVAALITR
jgi:hypothetical protein